MTPETIAMNVRGLEGQEFDNLDEQVQKALEFRDDSIIFLQSILKYSPFHLSETSAYNYTTKPMVFVHGVRGRNYDPFVEIQKIFSEGFVSSTDMQNVYVENYDPAGSYIWSRQWAERSSNLDTYGDRYLLEIKSAVGQAPDPIPCCDKDPTFIPMADPQDIRLIVLFDPHFLDPQQRIDMYHESFDDVIFI